MDDVEFATDLGKLELTTPMHATARSSHSGWDDLDEGLVTDVVTEDADSPEWAPRRAIFAETQGTTDQEGEASPAPSLGRRVLLAAASS